MTRLLDQAFGQAQKLPPAEQDAIAAIILEELADERQWQDAFARSQGQIAKLAEKARQDIQSGKVRNSGIDEL